MGNEIQLKPSEAALGSYKQRPALILHLSKDTVAVCTLDAWPDDSMLVAPSVAPSEEDTGVKEPWICRPVWTDVADSVDLCHHIDADVLKTRYLDTVFGAPIELFAKSVLSRIRTSYETVPERFETRLKELVLTPDQLDDRYKNADALPSDLQPRMLAWQDLHKAPIIDALRQLLFRETQVQIVVLLELETLTNELSSLLTTHFQRLCIWQAVKGAEKDEVLQFCSQIIIPFYRSRLPERTRQLAKTSRGVVYAHQRPRLKRAVIKPTRIASGQIAAQKALQRALESSQHSSGPSSDPVVATHAKSVPAKRSISRSMIAHEKRQVQVSFGRTQHQQPTPPPLPVPSVSRGLSTQRTKWTASKSQIHVEGTPQTKGRTVLLPKEPVPLDFGDAVDSTDDDNDY